MDTDGNKKMSNMFDLIKKLMEKKALEIMKFKYVPQGDESEDVTMLLDKIKNNELNNILDALKKVNYSIIPNKNI